MIFGFRNQEKRLRSPFPCLSIVYSSRLILQSLLDIVIVWQSTETTIIVVLISVWKVWPAMHTILHKHTSHKTFLCLQHSNTPHIRIAAFFLLQTSHLVLNVGGIHSNCVVLPSNLVFKENKVFICKSWVLRSFFQILSLIY